jgi:hypothetical protein
MRAPLTTRQAAEAIESYGDALAGLDRAFTRLCERMPDGAIDRINAIPLQDRLSEIIEDFRKLGAEMSAECDAAEEAEDRRRANPLEEDHRSVS